MKDIVDVENMAEINAAIETIKRQILKQPKPHAAMAVSKSLTLAVDGPAFDCTLTVVAAVLGSIKSLF